MYTYKRTPHTAAPKRVTFRGRKVFLDGALYGTVVGHGVQRGRDWVTDGNYRIQRTDGTDVEGSYSYFDDLKRNAEWRILELEAKG